MIVKECRNYLFIIFILLSCSISYGQSIKSLKLPRDYKHDNLDKIMADIGKDLKVRFIFDEEYLSRYYTFFTPSKGYLSKEKTLGDVFKTLNQSWDIITYISDDGYVYIAKDENQLSELRKSNEKDIIENIEIVQKERTGLVPIKKNFTISGIISDKNSCERIPYANIYVHGTSKGTSSDADGRFTLSNVPSDTCIIRIQYIGYLTLDIPLSPTKLNDPINIEIEPQPQQIADVFVVGRKNDKALQQYTVEHKMKMAPEALKLLPNVGEKDILRGFQLMPGVSASNESSSGMYVRGGTPDQNLILYDGFTVYYVDHMYGFYSAFNSNAIKDVQLYKGGFDSKYGGRLSSVTEITAKDGNKNRFTIGGEVSLLSFNAYTEIPIGEKFTSLFAFRRSYQGYMWNHISGQNKVADGQTEVQSASKVNPNASSPSAYFYDFNGKMTFTPTINDKISLSIFNGTDNNDNTPKFSFGGGMGTPPDGYQSADYKSIQMDNSDFSKYGNLGISARWTKKINNKLSQSLLMSYSNFYATRDQTRTVTVTEDDEKTTTNSGTLEENNLYDYSVKNDWQFQLSHKHTLGFGLFGTKYDIKYSYIQNAVETILDKRNDAVLAGIYLQDKISLFDNNFIVTPGIRVNYFTNTDKYYFEPRLSSSYILTENLTINAATGKFYQFANRIIREDIMSGNTDFWILSDGNDIPVSSSRHINLGLNYDMPNYIFSIEGYYKRNKGISEYTLRYTNNSISHGPGATESELKVTEDFYVGEGYATGIEFLAQKKAGKLSGWISYTLAQVKNKFPDQSDKYYFASQDVTNELKMVGIYKFGNFDVSATWIYSTGKPYTAPMGAYQITSASGVSQTYYAVSDKNNFRLPDYHRLDLSGSYRFNIFGTKDRPNAISISLFNAYNRHNVSAKQFQVVNNTILESNINYLSITPNVSLSFKF